MFNGLKRDIAAIKERDPAARNALEVLLLYSGLHALMMHRAAHWLYNQKYFLIARMISQFCKFLTGIEIHPGAKIGRGILIDHGSGVVIGETAEVGDDCTIYQGATLGGTGKDKGKRHPTLEAGVLVGSGAKILGPFTVGMGAKIAANAVVLGPIPAGCTAVGIPARIVSNRGEKVGHNADLDHVHIADPVALEIQKLLGRVEDLEIMFTELKFGKAQSSLKTGN